MAALLGINIANAFCWYNQSDVSNVAVLGLWNALDARRVKTANGWITSAGSTTGEALQNVEHPAVKVFGKVVPIFGDILSEITGAIYIKYRSRTLSNVHNRDGKNGDCWNQNDIRKAAGRYLGGNKPNATMYFIVMGPDNLLLWEGPLLISKALILRKRTNEKGEKIYFVSED